MVDCNSADGGLMPSDVTSNIIFESEEPVFTNQAAEIFKAYYSACGAGSDSVPVAVKRITYTGSKDAVIKNKRALSKEITALRLAYHEHILSFIGTCQKESTMCIVTVWAANGSLEAYLPEHPDTNLLSVLVQVASGLEYLHTPSPMRSKPLIVHGDLHIGNVLVTGDRRMVIADFGLCKVVPEGHEASFTPRKGIAEGRMAYIAPELNDPKSPALRSCKTDVFSFGVLGFHLYAGFAPFSSPPREAGIYSILLCINSGERPRRREVTRTDLSDSLWSLITKCWAQSPKTRPTMTEAHERLQSIVNGITTVPWHKRPHVKTIIHSIQGLLGRRVRT